MPIEDIDNEEQQPVVKSTPKLRKIIIASISAIIIIFILIVSILLVKKFVAPKDDTLKNLDEESLIDKRGSEPGAIFALDSIIVNMAEPDSDRYFKLEVKFEIIGDKKIKEKGLEEMEQRRSEIVDQIISIMSAKKRSDIINFAGKENLKKEILKAVNNTLITCKVVRVYFTDFVVTK